MQKSQKEIYVIIHLIQEPAVIRYSSQMWFHLTWWNPYDTSAWGRQGQSEAKTLTYFLLLFLGKENLRTVGSVLLRYAGVRREEEEEGEQSTLTPFLWTKARPEKHWSTGISIAVTQATKLATGKTIHIHSHSKLQNNKSSPVPAALHEVKAQGHTWP